MDAAGALDPRALEQELQAAVEEDERRDRENAAKLRALRQHLPSYEQFRSIVLASHLKPLEKKDKMGQRRNVLWNPCAGHAKAPLCQASDVEISQSLMKSPSPASL
uniref:Uncharacterized protein n=1 Tax=Melopsittacus undulatus TaxID=13146 RepID=A0A8V5GWU2_MELUD